MRLSRFCVASLLILLAPLARAQEPEALPSIPNIDRDLIVRGIVKGLEVANGQIQYFDFGEYVFGGWSPQPASGVFMPARFIVEAPVDAPTRDAGKQYWAVDVFRVGFNAGVRDQWEEPNTSSHGPVDISLLRVYEVIKVKPVADPVKALKEIPALYDPRRAFTTAFKSVTEQMLEALEPGEAVVVNRYLGAGASLKYLFAPWALPVGPKVSVAGDLFRQNGVVFLRTGADEIVASWRRRKSASAQAGVKLQAFFFSLPLLAESVRKEQIDDAAYAFDLANPAQRAALLESLGPKRPEFAASLGLAAQTRETRVHGEYRLASLLGFVSRKSSKENVEIQFGDERRGVTREILGSVRRKTGGTERVIEAVRVDDRTYLRLEVALKANAATAEELAELELRARKWFPRDIDLPAAGAFPALAGRVRLTTSVLYPEAALEDIFNPRHSIPFVCARMQEYLPSGRAWCDLLSELPTNVAVFERSREIRDPAEAQRFRETLLGMRDFLGSYRKTQKRFAEARDTGLLGERTPREQREAVKASLATLGGLLAPGPVLVPVLRTMDSLTVESRVLRQARLTGEAIDLDALSNGRGGYMPTPEEMGDLIQKAAETKVDHVYRAIAPVMFDYFEMAHIDRK